MSRETIDTVCANSINRYRTEGPHIFAGLGRAIRECVVSDDEPVRLATLDDDCSWFFCDGEDVLAIRPVYSRIWERINLEYTIVQNYKKDKKANKKPDFRRCLLVGNSGIGKTMSMNYYILQAVQAGIPVVVETRTKRFFVDTGADDALVEDLHLGTTLKWLCDRHDVLFFHDHSRKQEPPIIDDGAFTVAAVSPDVTNFQEFQKHKCLTMWVPLPAYEELWQMVNAVASRLTYQDFLNRVQQYGRVIRQIVRGDQGYSFFLLEQRINQFDVEKFVNSSLVTEQVLPMDSMGLSWWIVHVDADPSLEKPGAVEWASPEIERKILMRAATTDLEKLRRATVKAFNDPFSGTLPSTLFEEWSVNKLATGLLVKTYVYKGTELEEHDRVHFSCHTVSHTSSLPTLVTLQQNPNVIHYFGGNSPYYDACALSNDGICTLILFQMTIGKEHQDYEDTPTIPKRKVPPRNCRHLLEEDKEKPLRGPKLLAEATSIGMKSRFIFVIPRMYVLKLTSIQKCKSNPPIELAEVNPEI